MTLKRYKAPSYMCKTVISSLRSQTSISGPDTGGNSARHPSGHEMLLAPKGCVVPRATAATRTFQASILSCYSAHA